MRFSLVTPIWRDLSDPQPFRQTFDFVRMAEAEGYDTVTEGHHHFLMGNLSDPLTFIASLTSITHKIRFSTTIFLLAQHNPVRVAEQVALIDQLSGGRAQIGVGTGWRAMEYEAFGSNFKERGARMEEALKVMKMLWTQENVSFEGRFTRFPQLTLYPRPIQKPHPPLWVAGNSRPAIERAARLGDHWLCGPTESFSRIQENLGIYAAKCKEIGRSPDWVLRRYAWIGHDQNKIENEDIPRYVAGLMKHWRESTVDPERTELMRRIDAGEKITPQDIANQRLLWGNPDNIVRQIRKLQKDTNLQHLIVAFGTGLPAHDNLNTPAAGYEAISDMVRLFAREVMPAFR